MFVAASTRCLASESLEQALEHLAELEFTRVEIAVLDRGSLTSEEIAASPDRALHRLRAATRLEVAAFYLETAEADPESLRRFDAVLRLAKHAKATQLTVRASPIGTPFNAEVERLRALARRAAAEGVLLSIETETGRLTEHPDTAVELCQAVPGLGLTLDPSHYICGPHQGKAYDKVFPYTYHVHLRDTTRDKMQVAVGQGEIEYGRLAAQLSRYDYQRALSVEVFETNGDAAAHDAELRKLRLLLESLV